MDRYVRIITLFGLILQFLGLVNNSHRRDCQDNPRRSLGGSLLAQALPTMVSFEAGRTMQPILG